MFNYIPLSSTDILAYNRIGSLLVGHGAQYCHESSPLFTGYVNLLNTKPLCVPAHLAQRSNLATVIVSGVSVIVLSVYV